MTYQEVFPIGHPLKSLYALHAIREYLSAQFALAKSQQENGSYDRALRRVLGLVASAICDHEVIDNGSSAELKAALATRLVEQLLAILRGISVILFFIHLLFFSKLIVVDPSRPTSTPEYLNTTLIERLLGLLSSSLTAEPTSFAHSLVTIAFRAVLDACSLKLELWEWLQSDIDIREFVQKLLIDDDRDPVRKTTATIIGDKVTYTLR